MNDPIKLVAVHAETCLCDYWGGHHLPYIQVPVVFHTNMDQLKDMLHDELNCFVMNGPEDNSPVADEWYEAAHKAVDEIVCSKWMPFEHLPIVDDMGDYPEIYAYFVFVNEEEF